MSEFRDFINSNLNHRGWSGAEFARQMQRFDDRAASISAVNAWRRGEYLPKREHIPAIAQTLNASEQDIWRMVQPAVTGDMDVAEMLARELPSPPTPRIAPRRCIRRQ
jgi:transcriptional regulator with XRE-family HTH domain